MIHRHLGQHLVRHLGLVLTAAAPPLQDASPPAPDTGDWEVLNATVMIAGSDALTLMEFDRAVREMAELIEQPITTRQDEYRFRFEVLRDRMITMLEIQAGAESGYDPEQIQHLIRAGLDRTRREKGTARVVDELLEEGSTGLAHEEDEADRLYRYVFRAATLGWNLADRRPTYDEFVRPGELRHVFHRNRDALDPDQVRPQLLVMPVAASGSLEAAMEIAQDVRERALAGEDFDRLVLEYGAEFRDTLGLQAALPVVSIRIPEIREFCRTAEVGGISEIIPIEGPDGEVQDLVIVRLHELILGSKPEFEDRVVQSDLRQRYTRVKSQRQLERAHQELEATSFSWVDERLMPPPGGPTPAAGPPAPGPAPGP